MALDMAVRARSSPPICPPGVLVSASFGSIVGFDPYTAKRTITLRTGRRRRIPSSARSYPSGRGGANSTLSSYSIDVPAQGQATVDLTITVRSRDASTPMADPYTDPNQDYSAGPLPWSRPRGWCGSMWRHMSIRSWSRITRPCVPAVESGAAGAAPQCATGKERDLVDCADGTRPSNR